MRRFLPVALVALLAIVASGQGKLGKPRLTLDQYSYAVRTLTRKQAIDTRQFQEAAKQAEAAHGVPVRVALLEHAYRVYVVQLEGIAADYRKLQPPKELAKLSRLYVEGNVTLARLLRRLVPALRRQDKKAMAPIEEQIRQFSLKFPPQVKKAVIEAGFDYSRYERDLTFVPRTKK